MKILIKYAPMAHHPMRMNWFRCLSYSGHEVKFWHEDKEPIYDAMDRFEPDLFVGETYTTTASVCKAIAERPNMKVMMIGSDWGEQSKKMDLEKFKVLVANEQEVRLIEQLKKATGKPDVIFCHYHQNSMEQTHTYWRDRLGIDIFGLMSSADIFHYWPAQRRPFLECDIAFVGGAWGYKSQNIDYFLTPLFNDIGTYRSKVFGNQPHSVASYLGFLPEGLEKDLYLSAKVCVNTSEPHSLEFGTDIIERPWKVLMRGFLLEGGYVRSLHEDIFVGGEIPYAKTREEYREKVDFWIGASPEEREERILPARKRLFREHTCFDRWCAVFDQLGLQTAKRGMKEHKAKAFKDLGIPFSYE